MNYRINIRGARLFPVRNLAPRVMAMIVAGTTVQVERAEEDEATEFAGDSVFCQYAYILNLDDQLLEYYVGLNTNESAAGRYASSGYWTDPYEEKPYYGTRLVKNIPFAGYQEHTRRGIAVD